MINFAHARGRSPGGGGRGRGGGEVSMQQRQDPYLPCPEQAHWGEVQITAKSPVRSPKGRRLKLGDTLNPKTEGLH